MRRQFFWLITVGWLLYSLIGNYFAFGCIEKRYYARNNQPVIDIRQLQPTSMGASYSIDDSDYIDALPTFNRHPFHSVYSLVIPSGNDVRVRGWAIDFPAGAPASAVLLFVDHSKMYQAIYGLESDEALKQLHDQKYRFSGFGVLIPAKDLSPGKHSLSVKVVSANGLLLFNANREIQVCVK
jgi:hypothetical protein